MGKSSKSTPSTPSTPKTPRSTSGKNSESARKVKKKGKKKTPQSSKKSSASLIDNNSTPTKTPSKTKTKKSSNKDIGSSLKKVNGQQEATKITHNGFVALPLKITEGEDAEHFIYYKEHKAKANPHPVKRTIFVLNPPPGDTSAIRSIFEEFGPVEEVIMSDYLSNTQDTPYAPRVCHVIFTETKGVVAALQADTSTSRSLPEPVNVGMQKWESDYAKQYPGLGELQEIVDAAVNAFEDEAAKAKAKALSSANDGEWTVVQRGNTLGEGETAISRKKKKKKDQLNFYRFQQLAARKEQLANLRRKFDEDKYKMEQMRSARRFRPY